MEKESVKDTNLPVYVTSAFLLCVTYGSAPQLWAPGRLSPEAGAMGVAGSPLRLTAPICWMWQGEKATPGLR